jgi:hypothetical protein
MKFKAVIKVSSVPLAFSVAASRQVQSKSMQLKIARLCLDCDEVHETAHCPRCASEAFAYLTRWVPAPERRMRARPTTSPEAEVYRELVAADSSPPTPGRLLRQSALGVAVVAAAGGLWRWNEARKRRQRTTATNEAADRP